MKNKQNNGFVKNPLLYVLVVVALVTGFQYLMAGNSANQSQPINYTELVKEIKSGNIKEANEQLTFTYSVSIRNCIEGSNGIILADVDTNLQNGNYICTLECYDKHSSEFPCTIKDSKVLFKNSVLGGIIANNNLDDVELYILREANTKEKNS